MTLSEGEMVLQIVLVAAIIVSIPVWVPLLLGFGDRIVDDCDSRLLRFMDRLYDWARGY